MPGGALHAARNLIREPCNINSDNLRAFLAFLLGTGLGAMLTIFVAPAVTLLDLTGVSSQYNPYDVPPVQTIIPYFQLLFLLGGLVIICLVALLLMAYIVSRPSLSQTLRLNED